MLRSCLKSFRVILPALTMLALLSTAPPAFSAERHAETQPATSNGSGAPLAKIPQTNAIGAAPATVNPPSGSQGTAPDADQDDFSPAQADNLFSPGYQACMDRAAGVTTDMQDCIAAELERLEKIIAVKQIALAPVLGEERAKSLHEAVIAWESLRKHGSSAMYDPDGGTLSPLIASLWYLEQTARMAQWLNNLGDNTE